MSENTVPILWLMTASLLIGYAWGIPWGAA